MNLRRTLPRLPNYILRFGALQGARLWSRVERELPVKSTRVEEYRVPGLAAPVYLRETSSDHATFWQCLVRNQYELHGFPQTKRLMADYNAGVAAGRRMLIIDGGGNIGLSAVWLANAFPQAIICAVEPDAENFELLKRNTAALGDRIRPVLGGLWDARTELRIVNPESGSAAFRVTAGTAAASHAIQAYTIGDLCDEMGVAAPFIVKLDIEGAQARLFQSNTDWVRDTHLIMLELDDWQFPWGGTSRSFFRCVSGLPFDYLMSGETIFCFRDLESKD
jgi:FkbM family methyltransferase